MHDAQPATHFFASDRLRIRTGRLARSEREDHAAALDAREPEELFEPLGQEIE